MSYAQNTSTREARAFVITRINTSICRTHETKLLPSASRWPKAALRTKRFKWLNRLILPVLLPDAAGTIIRNNSIIWSCWKLLNWRVLGSSEKTNNYMSWHQYKYQSDHGYIFSTITIHAKTLLLALHVMSNKARCFNSCCIGTIHSPCLYD